MQLVGYDSPPGEDTAVDSLFIRLEKGDPLALLHQSVLDDVQAELVADVAQQVGDTHVGMDLSHYLSIARHCDFQSVSTIANQCIWLFNQRGILLIVGVQASKVTAGLSYFNYRPYSPGVCPMVLMNGTIHDDCCAADCGCGSLLRSRYNELLRYGSFILPWRFLPPIEVGLIPTVQYIPQSIYSLTWGAAV